MIFSKLMLGTVQFGLNYGVANTSGKPSYEIARDIIKAAYENGVNCLDTSASYGDSEEVLGRALAELELGDKMHVITKVDNISISKLSSSETEKYIRKSVETSLKRLRLERIYICLIHKEFDIEYIGILRKLQQKGIIGETGISLETNKYCEEVIARGIKYVQLPYNILDKRFDSFFPAAQANGVSVFTRSAYLQGLLLMPEEKIMLDLNDVIPVRHRLEKLAASAGMGMPELCIRFVLSNPVVTSVLTGVDNVEQLRQNLQLLEKGPLPAKLLKEVKEAVPLLAENIIRPVLWKKNSDKLSS
jgi:aryl-alcohol dehydrogenase-like predicted oxidoreductase